MAAERGRSRDRRTLYDLSEEELEDYEMHPENWEDVTNNTNEYILDMMYPNRHDADFDEDAIGDFMNRL